ncbi:MAG: T9SS type A sorting domain-containing protein [Bacteroidia bacterium]
MKRIVCLTYILFYFVAKHQAQNLIQNGSFENYTAPVNCSGGSGGFDNYSVFPVNHVVNNWYSLNSPDYFSSLCSGLNNDGSPINIFGNSNAKQGSNYVGGIFFQANYETKEYIYQQLTSPLQAGKNYCLSFYVSRADRVTHAIHSIGAYFSNNVQSAAALGYVNVMPQIVNQSGFITDTTNWVQIQGCYTANGGEQYITIGNFNSNINTDTLFVGSYDPHPGAYKYAYYYIDDVTLIDQSTVGFKELNNENSFEIYPNPTNSILSITDKNQQLQNATIEIKNTLGQIVYFDVYSHQIDVTHLPAGIYFISLNNKETKRTIKFVKE